MAYFYCLCFLGVLSDAGCHSWRHIGHSRTLCLPSDSASLVLVSSHFSMQCQWKVWVHLPVSWNKIQDYEKRREDVWIEEENDYENLEVMVGEKFMKHAWSRQWNYSVLSLRIFKVLAFKLAQKNYALWFFEFPVLTTHWTQMLNLLSIKPLHNAMNMETMSTCSPNLQNNCWNKGSKAEKFEYSPTDNRLQEFYNLDSIRQKLLGKFHKFHHWQSTSKTQLHSSL